MNKIKVWVVEYFPQNVDCAYCSIVTRVFSSEQMARDFMAKQVRPHLYEVNKFYLDEE